MAALHRLPRRRLHPQRGGTLTGLIIGLIIGLAIAVGVAMTIMKTPLPFVDKIGKQAQPAGELGDPNKTLPGGARERRESLNDTEGPAEMPMPLPAAVPKKSAPAALAPATPAALSPGSAAELPNASAPTGSADFTYYLQAGAFRELQDAEATKARLALMGVAATIAERKSEVGTLYRVRVGPFAEVEAMNRARVRLSDNGVDAAVVRVPK
jgi:cell division protein FtsN